MPCATVIMSQVLATSHRRAGRFASNRVHGEHVAEFRHLFSILCAEMRARPTIALSFPGRTKCRVCRSLTCSLCPHTRSVVKSVCGWALPGFIFASVSLAVTSAAATFRRAVTPPSTSTRPVIPWSRRSSLASAGRGALSIKRKWACPRNSSRTCASEHHLAFLVESSAEKLPPPGLLPYATRVPLFGAGLGHPKGRRRPRDRRSPPRPRHRRSPPR